jgi:glycosyltransferase involved in cell wall biosynthesis
MRLLEALRERPPDDIVLDLRVVGRRTARAHAKRIGERWIPARRAVLPEIAVRGADLVHLIGLDLPPPRRRSYVAMVHDLAALHYDDESAFPPWTDDIVRGARLLLTPSAFTASELTRHFQVAPSRIRVIGGGPALEAANAEPLSPHELEELGIEPPFVLRIGGYTKRKNVPLLVDAWTGVPTGTLVLAGPSHPVRARILAAAPASSRIVVLDYLSQTLLSRLLRSAGALVSTSSYEGFGLPPLEAMAAGTPVVAVDTPFVREICGDAAILVERHPDALAQALAEVLADAELSERLRAAGRDHIRGWTWSAAADRVIAAYRSALG